MATVLEAVDEDEGRDELAWHERMLDSLAGMGGDLLSRYDGDLGIVKRSLGGKLFAPRMGGSRMEKFVGKRHGFPQIESLIRIGEVGVPVGVEPGGGEATQELTYGTCEECLTLQEGGDAESKGGHCPEWGDRVQCAENKRPA